MYSVQCVAEGMFPRDSKNFPNGIRYLENKKLAARHQRLMVAVCCHAVKPDINSHVRNKGGNNNDNKNNDDQKIKKKAVLYFITKPELYILLQ